MNAATPDFRFLEDTHRAVLFFVQSGSRPQKAVTPNTGSNTGVAAGHRRIRREVAERVDRLHCDERHVVGLLDGRSAHATAS